MCDLPSPEQLLKMKQREIENHLTEKKRIKGLIRMALDELGIPTEDYPAPISNAMGFLNTALKGK